MTWYFTLNQDGCCFNCLQLNTDFWSAIGGFKYALAKVVRRVERERGCVLRERNWKLYEIKTVQPADQSSRPIGRPSCGKCQRALFRRKKREKIIIKKKHTRSLLQYSGILDVKGKASSTAFSRKNRERGQKKKSRRSKVKIFEDFNWLFLTLAWVFGKWMRNAGLPEEPVTQFTDPSIKRQQLSPSFSLTSQSVAIVQPISYFLLQVAPLSSIQKHLIYFMTGLIIFEKKNIWPLAGRRGHRKHAHLFTSFHCVASAIHL